MAEPTLPSIVAAEALWREEPGALGKVGYSMLERAAIVAPALWLSGTREVKPLFWQTLTVVTFIEAVVIWQVQRQLKQP